MCSIEYIRGHRAVLRGESGGHFSVNFQEPGLCCGAALLYGFSGLSSIGTTLTSQQIFEFFDAIIKERYSSRIGLMYCITGANQQVIASMFLEVGPEYGWKQLVRFSNRLIHPERQGDPPLYMFGKTLLEV